MQKTITWGSPMLSQIHKYFNCYAKEDNGEPVLVRMNTDAAAQAQYAAKPELFLWIDVLKTLAFTKTWALQTIELMCARRLLSFGDAEIEYFEIRWLDRIIHIVPTGVLERDFCRNEVPYFTQPHLETGYLKYTPNETYGTRRRVNMHEMDGTPKEVFSEDPYEHFIIGASLPATLFTVISNSKLANALIRGYEDRGGIPVFYDFIEASKRRGSFDTVCSFVTDEQDIKVHLHGMTLTGSGTGSRVFHAYFDGTLVNLSVA